MAFPRRYRYTLWMLVGLLVPLVVGIAGSGYVYYVQYRQQALAHEREELTAIADLKVAEIAGWHAERIGDARAIVQNRALARSASQVLGQTGGAQARADLQPWMDAMRYHHDYRSVLLMDLRGQVRLSSGPPGDPPDAAFLENARQATREGEVAFGSFTRDGATGRIHIDLIAPVVNPGAAGRAPLGFFLLRIDPERYLYPRLQAWPMPTRSGETLLARRDGDRVLFLNELRHRKGTAVRLRLPADDPRLPAAAAVSGREGPMEGLDYRGVPVLAVLRRVPETPWFLVAKVDRAEIEAPIRERGVLVLLVTGSLLAVAVAVLALLRRRQQAEVLRQQYEARFQQELLARQYDSLSRYANDIILLIDQEGQVVEANERAVSAYGYPREELLRLRIADLRPEGERAAIAEQMRLVRQQGGAVFETVHLRRDGTPFPVEVSSRSIEVDGRRFFQSIVRDISERRRAEDALVRERRDVERLNAELREADEAKDRFLAILSHELRNPLATIVAGLEVLRRSASLEGRAARTLDICERSARLLTRMVNELLDVSRITRGTVELRRQPLLLDRVVTAAVDAQREEAAAADIHLEVEASPGLWVCGDADRLQQVVGNLVANALKFTPAGGVVSVRVWGCGGVGEATDDGRRETERRGNEDASLPHTPTPPHTHTHSAACIVVEDNGAGISPEVLPTLFQMFRQGEPAGKGKQGLGIGLALAQTLVEKHGGRIWAESEGVGKGSRFTVALPRIAPPDPVAPSPADEPADGCSQARQGIVASDAPQPGSFLSPALRH